MMKIGAPWSIKGIDDDIRDAAHRAARRSGLTVAEWLNQAIAHQSNADGIAPRWRDHEDQDDSEADFVAVAAALQRLTRRIRAMDKNSRAALTDLHSRLDEIVNRLGSIAQIRGEPSAVTPSLRGIATIVDDLSRDIDNADEKARSTVEGLRRRVDSRERDPGIDRITEAIRGLDVRVSSMTQRMAPPIPDEAPANLETIKSRLDALLAGGSGLSTPGTDSLDQTLSQLASHVEEAKNRLARSNDRAKSRSMTSDDEGAMRRSESHAADPSGFVAGLSGGKMSSAVAEISARQKSIDEDADIAALARGQQHISASLATLKEEVAKRLSDPEDRAKPSGNLSDSAGLLRLDAIGDDIAALRDLIEATDGGQAMARLETRIAEIVQAVEAIPGAANAASTSAADKTIDQLEAHLGAIAERIDLLGSDLAPKGSIEEISGRLDALGERFSDLQSAGSARFTALDELRTELIGLRQEIAEGEARGHERLKDEIAQLTSRLDAVALPGATVLTRVESDLSLLRGHLADSREESVEASRSAAREFVREMIGSSGDNLLTALKADLEAIRAAGNAADQRTQETLDSVQEMLARVVDRLSLLESENLADDLRAPVWATGTYGAAAPALPTDRRASESRMSKPDIAALRELARSAAHGQSEAASDRKADFIAAARRASQTAAASAAAAADDLERKPGAFARINQAIRNRRRPLLLAAPALVLAVSAIHFGAEWGGTEPLARSDPASAAGIDDPAALPATVDPKVDAVSTAISTVGKTDSTAPADNGPAAIAFTAPESRRSRFGSAPDAPPATGFVRFVAFETPLDEAVGTPALRAAAVAGDSGAAAELAARYAEGKLVERDLSKAAYWYERAAERGNAVAQYRLASLYQRGAGVEADRATAAAWFKQAANLGNVGAMHNLAVMMSDSVEGAANYAGAVSYYRAAANHGVADSQYNLGVIYARGLGAGKDLGEAYKWFALAAASGDDEAGSHRDEIGRHLSSEDLAAAQRAVAAWRPRPMVAKANAPAATPRRESLETAEISEADRRSLVAKIQTLLADQGYDPGPADGFEGPKTQQAVRAYQRNIGLAETGEISNDLVAALVDAPR